MPRYLERLEGMGLYLVQCHFHYLNYWQGAEPNIDQGYVLTDFASVSPSHPVVQYGDQKAG